MKLVEGVISHRGVNRLRIRIEECRGDADFFHGAGKRLAEEGRFGQVETNSLTGSILIISPHPDVDAVARFAKDHRLFSLVADPAASRPMPERLAAVLKTADRKVRQVTDGELDLAGGAFILFFLSGLYELARGNVKPPPWYTAFWYAFGAYSAWLFNYKGRQLKTEAQKTQESELNRE